MMMGENHSFENGLPWSPFPDGFSGVSSAGIRQMTMPVSGVSSPHGHSLTGNYFSGSGDGSDGFAEALAALQRFLPSNNDDGDFDDSAVDAYSCDEFRMYDFKVRRCVRGRSHDWTECPYVHPGEKARRRDPRKFHYSGTACPEFRKGSCRRGDACEFSHGVFECWLHPARYRTQPCKDGTACRRKVCFFAHTPEQLRVLPASHSPPKLAHIVAGECYDGSPLRQALAVNFDYDNLNMKMISSPTSILAAGHGVDSPPMISPSTSPPLSPANAYPGCGFSSPRARNPVSVSDVLASMQKLHLGRSKSAPWPAPSVQFSNHVSPRGLSSLRPAFSSLPSTPTAVSNWPDPWENSLIGGGIAEEEPMERVESGRDVRARMFERLRKQNSGERAETASPDVGWVSELVK